jgi:hypothetical protein
VQSFLIKEDQRINMLDGALFCALGMIHGSLCGPGLALD